MGIWKLGVRLDRQRYRRELEGLRAQAARDAAPGGAELALVSDFEDGTTNTAFGSGWQVSTDAIAGGESTAQLRVIQAGAQASRGALEIRGTIAPGLPFAWAGAIFFPGSQPFLPRDASAKRGISFWAKGDGRTYRVMLFAESLGQIPVARDFVGGRDWTEFSYAFSEFPGVDPAGLTAVLFAGGPEPGDFELLIDRVTLW